MPTPLSLGNDAGSNKVLNMLRDLLTYPTQVHDKGCGIISEVMRCKTLYYLHITDTGVNNVFGHVFL
eukprot:11615174-Ditylum_brightwellii.AAC.1